MLSGKRLMTDNRQENSLTSEQVCLIIEASGKAKVAKLEFRDLYLEFGQVAQLPTPEVVHMNSFVGQSVNTAHPSTPAAEMADIQTKIAQESLEQDEISVRQDRLMQMLIENPHEAEKMIMSEGFNEDDGSEEDEEA